MILLIDLDDTIWELLNPWIYYLNNRYNLNKSSYKIKNWDISVHFPEVKDKEKIYKPLTEKDFWKLIKPKKDAIYYINKLNDLVDIYFVTATNYKNIEYKINILQKYFPNISTEKLITCYNKNLIKGDLLVDDNINNIKDRQGKAILCTSVHNRNLDTSIYSHITRCNNWKDIYDYICKNYIKGLKY